MIHLFPQYLLRTSLALLLLWIGLSSTATAQSLVQRLRAEPVQELAQSARQSGNAVRGAILFTRPQLNCTRCHTLGESLLVGPDLKTLGIEATDTYLIEALLDPSKVIKKGFESVRVETTAGKTYTGRIVAESPSRIELQLATDELPRVSLPRTEIDEIAPSSLSAMPDNLIDQLESRDQFLDLARYLMELAATEPQPAHSTTPRGGQTVSPELWGIALLKDFNCQACHADDDGAGAHLTAKQAPDLARTTGMLNPEFLLRFLADPVTTRPGTTMPDLLSGLSPDEREVAAQELAHYLVSISQQRYSDPVAVPEAIDRGRELFHTVGCVACHSPRDDQGRELLSETSVPLGAINAKYSLGGLAAFLENPLEFRPSGRMPHLQLSHWEAIELASYLKGASSHPTQAPSWEPDPKLVSLGQARFDQLGCRQCHAIDAARPAPTSLPLSRVHVDRGCLSEQSGRWPEFHLSAAQRLAIKAALQRPAIVLTDSEQVAVTLTALRCLACHERNELGGVPSDRDRFFQTTNPNLGPQGRIPPPLTGVGAKLNSAWLRQVLVSGRPIRPYVLTRMPQFGKDNVVKLVDSFRRTDQRLPLADVVPEPDANMREIGAELAGSQGLNCIVCHTFQSQQAANMPAVDLTEMAERLQKSWFYQYMCAPQSFSPNTIMPSYWPGGHALRTDILDGERDLQIEALWQYLEEGREARAPRGLVAEPIELLATTDEAVMLRRSYPDIGKRGIGVGYPLQVNLAFDAEQLRLAMLWKGKFADPAGVWRSQGHGNVRPLGKDLIRFAPGPDLDDADNPWTVDEGRPPNHQFLGYQLDEKRRPRLRYRFADVDVVDALVDEVDSSTGEPFLRRTVTLSSTVESDRMVFRAATGAAIVENSPGEFVVDDHLRIHVGGPHVGMIDSRLDMKRLVIYLNVGPGTTVLNLEYRW